MLCCGINPFLHLSIYSSSVINISLTFSFGKKMLSVGILGGNKLLSPQYTKSGALPPNLFSKLSGLKSSKRCLSFFPSKIIILSSLGWPTKLVTNLYKILINRDIPKT